MYREIGLVFILLILILIQALFKLQTFPCLGRDLENPLPFLLSIFSGC